MSAWARRIARSTAVRAAGHVVTTAVTAVGVVVMTHYLTPAEYGVYVTATTFVALFAVLVDGGLVAIGVREAARQPDRERDLFTAVLTLRFLLSLAAVLASLWLSRLLYGSSERTEIATAVAIVAASLLLTGISGTYRLIAEVRLQLTRLVLGDVLGRIAGLAALLLAVRLDLGLHAVVAVAVVAPAATLLALVVLYRGDARPSIRFRGMSLMPLWRASLPLGLALLINTLFFRVDALILSVLRSPAEVGIYGLAYRVLEVVLAFGAFFLASIFPVLSRVSEDRERWERISRRAFRVTFAAGLPVAACGALLADEIVALISREEAYRGAGAALSVLLLAAALSWVNGCGGMMLISIDRQRQSLWLNVGALTFNVLANLLFVPKYGFMAAAWVTVLSELVNFSGMIYLVRRYGQMRWGVDGWRSLVVLTGVLAGVTWLLDSAGIPVVVTAPVVAVMWWSGLLLVGVLPRGRLRPAEVLTADGTSP